MASQSELTTRRFLTFLFILLLIFFIVFLFWYLTRKPLPIITVASWNLQVFGDKKANDPALISFYAQKMRTYDVVFVQEIRDADGNSWKRLCVLLENYTCAISSRAGSSSSKEQYGLAYRQGVVLVNLTDYNPAYANGFERPPMRADLSVDGYNLSVYVIHVRPDSVADELAALERLVEQESPQSENVLVLGDMNADCSYYNERNDVAFRTWRWVISDGVDTTAGKNSCTYDRILLNKEASEELAGSGVDSAGITADISDHYLVWVSMEVQERS